MTYAGFFWRWRASNCFLNNFNNLILQSSISFDQIIAIMPVHPSEEIAPEGLTEKIAKDPSSNTESTASTHEHHHNEHTPGDVKAQASDFQTKGPQIPTNMSGTSIDA